MAPFTTQVLFLRQHSGEKVIVYFLTCSCVDFFSLALRRLGSKLLPGLQVGESGLGCDSQRLACAEAAWGQACLPGLWVGC